MATAFNYTDLGPPGSRRGIGAGVANGPGPRQLNRETLRNRLGADFDADRMSIDQPPTHSRVTGVPEFDPELVDELRALDFSYKDERGERRTLPAAVRGVVERWLLQRAVCPIRYAWLDMGTLFWPRWIKQGYCDAGTPCSWPAGMHCTSAVSETLRLLHWQCRRSGEGGGRRRVKRRSPEGESGAALSSSSSTDNEDGRRPRRSQRQHQQHCRWKKVPYPITTECFCSC